MAEFKIKANDRKPSIEATLGFSGAALPGELVGTVKFIMRKANGPVPAADAPVVNAAATIVDPATWRVRYDWLAVDTATPGLYLAEWEVTDGAGKKQTFPTESYHSVQIFADLDGA